MRVNELNKALECFNSVLGLGGEYAGKAVASKGTVLQMQGKNKEAIECFRIAVSLNPGDLFSWFNMGTTYYSMEDISTANLCFQKAVSLGLDPRLVQEIISKLKEK